MKQCEMTEIILRYGINESQTLDFMGFPGNSDGKESACNARDQGSNPGSGRSPGERNVNLFQYSYLENSMDRGGW